MNDNKISDIIISRIHLKKMESWAKVKSLTLGVEIWNELKDELLRNSAIYCYFGIYTKEFYGLPVKVSYKRPRLIQVNRDVKRRPRNAWRNEYMSHLKWPSSYSHSFFSQEVLDRARKSVTIVP